LRWTIRPGRARGINWPDPSRAVRLLRLRAVRDVFGLEIIEVLPRLTILRLPGDEPAHLSGRSGNPRGMVLCELVDDLDRTATSLRRAGFSVDGPIWTEDGMEGRLELRAADGSLYILSNTALCHR
jgi:hypothetical protein